MLGKKANGVVVILLIIVIIFIIAWGVSKSGRECSNNVDCGTDRYCGSDFRCHDIPAIEKTVVEHDYIPAALIIAMGMIAAAIILKKKKSA